MIADPYSTCLTQTLGGDILGGALCPYVSMMGLPLVITFLLLIGMGLSYMKWQMIEAPAFMLVIGGGVALAAVEPQLKLYFAILVVIGFVTGVYSFYKSKPAS